MLIINGVEYRMIYEFHQCEFHKIDKLQTYPNCTCYGNARCVPMDDTENTLEYYKHRFANAWKTLATSQ